MKGIYSTSQNASGSPSPANALHSSLSLPLSLSIPDFSVDVSSGCHFCGVVKDRNFRFWILGEESVRFEFYCPYISSLVELGPINMTFPSLHVVKGAFRTLGSSCVPIFLFQQSSSKGYI